MIDFGGWGKLTDEGIYITERWHDKGHFCRKYKGYGVQASIMDEHRPKEVWVVVKDRGVTYASKGDLWFERGIRDTLNPTDGEQIFLPLATMRLREVDGVAKLEEFA